MIHILSVLAFLFRIAYARIEYAGVNSAGGEFGQLNLPGQFGTDYQFIDKQHVDTFVDNGVNVFRVPFLLERMCNVKTVGLGKTFDETYWGQFNDAIEYITATKGKYALVDPHNYMRYNDPSGQPSTGSVIGDENDPSAAKTEAFKLFWGEMARRLKGNKKVIFGLMNEPHDMPTELVLKNDQAAIDAIRAAGATSQLVLVPGNAYTGVHSWTTGDGANTPNSEVMGKISDPNDNWAFDMHQYLDSDYSGTQEACISPDNVAGLFDPATNWLKQNGFKAFLSEFGSGHDDNCIKALKNLINHLNDNSEQWIGWTYWSAGPIWSSDYFLNVEPDTGVEYQPIFQGVLKSYIRGYKF